MRTLTRTSWLWSALIATVALAGNTSTPISYSTTFADGNGAQKSITFNGAVSGTSLAGTLSIADVAQQVHGTIASDGSVAGTLAGSDGKQIGTFSGKPNGPNSMSGTYTVTGGQTFPWSVPLRVPTSSSP